MVALRAGSATDVGLVRSNNQDSLLTADPLYAVADGMGGAAAGEVASSLAIEALERGFDRSGPLTPDLLVEAAQTANRAVWDTAEAHPEMRGMGTTLVAVALVEGPQLAVINIGDSRLYLLHDDELRQVTLDHNLVAEMVAEGRITPAEAEVHPRRNIMTRALGVDPDVPVDLFVEEPRVGDRYLLCSDGLPRELSDDLIASLLRRIADPQEAARELVDEAKRRGGNDNITVVVVDVVDQADPPGGVDEAGEVAGPTDATTALGVLPSDPPTPAGTGDVTTAFSTAALAAATGEAATAGAGDTGAAGTGAAGTGAAVTGAGAAPAGSARRRRLPRRGDGPPRAPRPPTKSPVTPRVVAFIVLILLILGAAAAAIVWYARSSYYVGLRGQQIVIFQGRPGGVLGLDPTLRQSTRYTTADVLPAAVPALQSGQEEPSLTAAQQYVHNLVNAYAAAQAAGGAGPTTATTSPTTSPTSAPAGAPTTAGSTTAPTAAHPAVP